MANRHETTFRDLQVDERFKKLQRSLKLAILKQEHSKIARDGRASSVTTWPSISSINVDTLDSDCVAPSLQSSTIKSEVLASSNNLRNILLKKNSRDTKQDAITTSSVKRYHVQQDKHVDQLIMPPPARSTVYRAFREPADRVHTSSNCKRAASTSSNRFVQSPTNNTFSLKSAPSWISINTNAGKEYPNTFMALTIPTNNFQKIDRVFSKWKVILNDQYELIIKGTLECGRIARSKPVIRRYSATCVESKYKHKYILQGNIVDERSGLPDYIRGKFYNGFPDDWENVYQIWRTYVSQRCPVTFRWPTPVTDSDDDLKSEMTDLTYTCVKKNKPISATRSCNLNDHTKTEKLNNISEKKEEYQNYSTHSSQNYEKNTSFTFVKPFIFNSSSEKDIIPVVQARNVKSLCDEDKQSVKTDINPPSSSRKVNKLKDILQEDQLNIIIKNLADRNCSPKYIDKIIEMFDCLDYVVSYRTESECNNDSMVSASHETSRNSETISLQRNSVCNDNHANTSKLEQKLTKTKNGHSTDLGYGSIRNDSNAIQLSNPINSKRNDKDLDESESETYAGVPKISIDRILKAKEMSRKTYKYKVRKKTDYPDAQKHASNLPYNAEEVKSESVYMANPFARMKRDSLPDESCVSITEDEGEVSDTRRCREVIEITPRPQEMMFSNRQEIQRNNFNAGRQGGSKSVTRAQNEQPFDAFEAQKVNMNVFRKEQKIPYINIEGNAHSHFVADVDYTTNSDIDVVTVSRNARKTGGNTIASHTKVNQDIVTISESNSDFPEKPRASPKLCKKFIEQTKSGIAMKKSKPTVISSMPVNLKLRINSLDSGQPHDSRMIVKNGDKQDANIRPLEKTDEKKSTSNMPIAAKPTINDSHSKTTTVEAINNKKEIRLKTDNENESDNINPTNSTTNPTNEQHKSSKLGAEEHPKVLTAWTPKVVYYAKSKSELLGLTFQGKLLNDAGHIVHRKFTTDIVARRLSATLIETVNHEFYKLLGHLNDNKHTIPKELVRQCRNGCPAKIEEFCVTWKTLQDDDVQEVGKKFYDTMNLLNAPVSSRGRRILPPLSYWTGERITLKDDNPVYNQGSSQESSLLSLTDNSKEMKKSTMNTEERKTQEVNSKNTPKKQSVNEQTLLPKSNQISRIDKNLMVIIEKIRVSKKSPEIKTANVKRSDDSKKSWKSINGKRRLVQKLTFSSTDSSSEEEEVSSRKRARNPQTNENEDPEYTVKKRHRIETTSNRVLCRNRNKPRDYTTYYSPTKKCDNKETTCTYYQDIPQSENFLSDNEISSI